MKYETMKFSCEIGAAILVALVQIGLMVLLAHCHLSTVWQWILICTISFSTGFALYYLISAVNRYFSEWNL